MLCIKSKKYTCLNVNIILIIMGITDSNSKPLSLAIQNHKPIRRYTCQAYGDVTIIHVKGTKGATYAMKQFISESPQTLQLIKKRKELLHPHLIQLKEYWSLGEESICSNLRNVSLMFELLTKTLDDQVQQRTESKNLYFDAEIINCCLKLLKALAALENAQFTHILGSMKSILVDGDNVKILQHLEFTLCGKQRNVNAMSLLNRKIMPFHPMVQPKQTGDFCLQDKKIRIQNLFSVGLIGLGMCFLRDPLQLGIFNKNSYNFSKINRRLEQISQKYPQTHHLLQYLLREQKMNVSYRQLIHHFTPQEEQAKVLKSRENRVPSLKLINIEPIEKVNEKKTKKVGEKKSRNPSYYRSTRYTLHNINQ